MRVTYDRRKIMRASLDFILKPSNKKMIFPALILICLAVATLLKLSGTSVSVYEYYFGQNTDANLVIGQPRTVRSDEWAVNTPFVVSQVKEDFPVTSQDIGYGQDMTVVIDAPYRDWSVFFKPQNLMFFVLPPEYAFAFKWWLLAILLLIATYSFVLTLYPKKYLLASLVSTAFFLSPFIQWWYQTITILPIAYALFAVAIAIKLIESTSNIRLVAWGGLLAYVLTCFTLTMYPAFQLTAAIFALFVFVALLLPKKRYRQFASKRLLVACAIILTSTAIIAGLYVLQHLDVIKAIQSTVYPGERNVLSGGFDPLLLLVWPFSYLLLDGGPTTVFGSNQSEISSFLFVGFLLAPYLLWLSWNNDSQSLTNREKVVLISILGLSLVILFRMFIPIGDSLFGLVGLNKIPHVRLVLALGLINMVLIALAVGRSGNAFETWRGLFTRKVVILSITVFVLLSIMLLYIRHTFDISTVGWKELLLIVILFTSIITALTHHVLLVRYSGLGLLLLTSFAFAGPVNPLYMGLGAFNNEFTNYAAETEKQDSKNWIAIDNPILSSMLVSSGAETMGGVNTYPQKSLWQESFPKEEDVFDRYAHIRFVIDDSAQKPYLSLVQSDSFKVIVSSCDPLLRRLEIGYIVSDINPAPTYECFDLNHSLISGRKPIFVYSIK